MQLYILYQRVSEHIHLFQIVISRAQNPQKKRKIAPNSNKKKVILQNKNPQNKTVLSLLMPTFCIQHICRITDFLLMLLGPIKFPVTTKHFQNEILRNVKNSI